MPNSSNSCRQSGCSHSADGGKGYCGRHYQAWRRGKLAKARFKTCRVEGCHKAIASRGRCAEHFTRDYPGKSAVGTEAPAAGA